MKSNKVIFNQMNKLKKISVFTLVLGLLVTVVSVVSIHVLKSYVRDQYMAKYWSSGSDYSYRQISMYARNNGTEYIDTNSSIDLNDVVTIRTFIQALIDQQNIKTYGKENVTVGLKEDGTPQGWEDSYSSFTKGSIDGTDIDIFGVGGNFKAFRDFEYLSGSFLPEEEFNQNLVVINEHLAWKLFLSSNVEGRDITINDSVFKILGVVRDDENTSLEEYTDGNNYRCYIYFSKFKEITKTEHPGIITYEVFMPEFTRGVAINDFKNAIPVYSENNPQLYVISNTDRFSILNIINDLFPLGQRDYMLKDYNLPYWELLAQEVSERLFITGIFTLTGTITTISSAARIITKRRDYHEEIN